MSTPTYISAGSTTQVRSGPGSLYGVHITPANGASVVFIDATDAGSIASNFAQDPIGIFARIGVYAAATPDFIEMKGVHFNSGLIVSATSSARLTVLHSA